MLAQAINAQKNMEQSMEQNALKAILQADCRDSKSTGEQP